MLNKRSKSTQRHSPPRHILFILTDQLRADSIGCAGHPLVKTPNIDRLAAQGTHFTNCFTTSPLCVPARISIANGLYPHNSNLWTNDSILPLDADTYANRLRDAGYRTCSIGKNHLFPMENCDLYKNEPQYHTVGFDHIEDMSGTWGIIEGKSVYTDYLADLGLLDGLRRYLRDLEAKPDEARRFIAEPLPIPAEHYIDAFIATRAAQYVEQYSSDQPSFVFVGFQGPHEPWDAPQEYTDLYDPDKIPETIPILPFGDWLPERSRKYRKWAQYYQPKQPYALKEIAARYLGKITQIDDSIGQILQAYRNKGWIDDTVIIFASDHGEMLGDLARLSKSVFYESALRVPLIVRLPDSLHSRRTCDAMVETIDIHGTILDIAGCEISRHKDCLSLLPLLEARTEALRKDILSEVHAHYMLRTDQWKIVIGRDGSTLQLFDLHSDPMEQCDLCGHPDYVSAELEMRSRLLGRIAGNTLRITDLDPESCEHAFPEK